MKNPRKGIITLMHGVARIPMARLWCVPVILMLALLCVPLPVAAHTSLLQTDPVPNSTLDHSPDRVTLRFDEQLQAGFSKATVFDASQRPVKVASDAAGGADPSSLTIGLPKLATGVYSVVWQVLSPDGHVVRGAFVFTVALPGDPPPAFVASVPQIDGLSVSNRPPALAVLLRALRYAGIAALVGGIAIFLFCIAPALNDVPADERAPLRRTLDQRLQRWLFIALGVALGAHVLSLLVQVATVNGVTLLEALRIGRITDLIKNTTYGAVWRMQAILLLALGEWIVLLPAFSRVRLPRFPIGIVATPTHPRVTTKAAGEATTPPLWGWGVALVGGLVLLLMTVFGGHTLDVKSHPALAMLADWAHLAAMSVWFGGLILVAGLVPALMHSTAGTAQWRVATTLIGRFSRLAMASIATLTVTGIYAITEHTTRSTLATTTYGLVVIGKVGLVAAIILVAALNRAMLGRRAVGDTDSPGVTRAQTILLRGISAEVMLGVAVIGLTGLLTQLPPANTQAATMFTSVAVPSAPAEVVVAQPTLEADGVRSLLTVETKGPDATFDARITDTTGAPRADVTRVTIWLNSGDRDVGLITVPLLPTGDGHYRATGQWFAIGQHWLARVIVRRQDVAEDVKLPFALQPRPTAFAEEPVPPSPFLWPRLLPEANRGVALLVIGVGLIIFTALVRPNRRGLRRGLAAGAVGLIVIGLIVTAWYSMPTSPLTGRKNPQPATPKVIAQGAALYAQNGQPGSQLTTATARQYTDGDLYWLLTNGDGRGMPAYNTRLSPTERWQVVRYLRSIE